MHPYLFFSESNKKNKQNTLLHAIGHESVWTKDGVGEDFSRDKGHRASISHGVYTAMHAHNRTTSKQKNIGQ